MTEKELEQSLIGKLTDLKYTRRPDIRDRADLEGNFRNHFQALNRVQLTDGEFKRLLDEIITPDVFTAATQLDQYTDLTEDQRQEIEQTLPKDDARAFRGVYLETAKRLKAKQDKTGETPGAEDGVAETVEGGYGNDAIDQLDFEFVLFASADIDYDYIMNLIARYSGQTPGQQEMSRDQLIRLIRSDAKFMDELDEITEYVRPLETGRPLTEEEVRNGYERFKDERHAAVADKHGLTNEALQSFVDGILDRMIFDGEQLTDLMAPLDLGWRERREKELALMDDLIPLLKKRAGRTISGLNAYEQ